MLLHLAFFPFFSRFCLFICLFVFVCLFVVVVVVVGGGGGGGGGGVFLPLISLQG